MNSVTVAIQSAKFYENDEFPLNILVHRKDECACNRVLAWLLRQTTGNHDPEI